MSNCQNCFNGCTETTSDQCVKYTGIDIPTLGISNGDPLSVIEQSLTTFLVSALNGTGIKIDLSSIDVCTVVQQYLPTCGEMSIADISKALIQASCDIQEQVDAIVATLAVLNADYTIGCLPGVTASSDTHAVVQAAITKLCSVDVNVTSILDQLPLFVTKSELCDRIVECSTNNAIALASTKMIPYGIIPYYGPISGYPTVSDGFSSTGAGYGYWLNVYYCNGQNPQVPDLRGRVPVGSTDMYGSNWPADGTTQPGINGNPYYDYTIAKGSNTTILSLAQIPAHTHIATAESIALPHTHNTIAKDGAIIVHSNSSAFSNANGTWANLGTSDTKNTGIESATVTVNTTVTNSFEGNNAAHSNVQPGLAVYYLIYIP